MSPFDYYSKQIFQYTTGFDEVCNLLELCFVMVFCVFYLTFSFRNLYSKEYCYIIITLFQEDDIFVN